MPFNKGQLEADILTAFTAAAATDRNAAAARARLAASIANAIDAYVKAVKVAANIPVSTTGTASAQTGATTGMGNLV